MIKNKTLKTILIIFAVITVVGVTAGLFGGLRSPENSEDKVPHEHSFEVISSEPGTCTNPGTETVKCKTCFYTETREGELGKHTYDSFYICTDCGGTDVHTEIYSQAIDPWNMEESPEGCYEIFSIPFDFNYEGGILVDFVGADSYYAYYDGMSVIGIEDTDCLYLEEYYLDNGDSELHLYAGDKEAFLDSSEVTVYLVNSEMNFVYFFSDNDVYCFDFYVDGRYANPYGRYYAYFDDVTVEINEEYLDKVIDGNYYVSVSDIYGGSADINYSLFSEENSSVRYSGDCKFVGLSIKKKFLSEVAVSMDLFDTSLFELYINGNKVDLSETHLFENVSEITIKPLDVSREDVLDACAWQVYMLDSETGDEEYVGYFNSSCDTLTFEPVYEKCEIYLSI